MSKITPEEALPDASEGRPKLLASLTSSNGSRDVWWYRQGEDLWESQRIFGVVTHTGSRSLLVDRTSSDPAALELYDNDLSDQPKAIHAERIPVPPHLAEAQRRVAELEGKLAQSTNYVADDELYPHVVWFANGRTVSIASGGHLEIGMGGRLAAAKGDVSDEP